MHNEIVVHQKDRNATLTNIKQGKDGEFEPRLWRKDQKEELKNQIKLTADEVRQQRLQNEEKIRFYRVQQLEKNIKRREITQASVQINLAAVPTYKVSIQLNQ